MALGEGIESLRPMAGERPGGRYARLARILMVGAALTMAICATVIIGGGGEGARGALAGGRSELIGQGSDGDLCSSFSDPAECRAFRDKAKHRYWTEGETRSELWKVMKGVAMMDEKMNAADKAHSHAFDSQKRSVAHASRCCC
jgi:hypothetical protein